MRKAKPRFLVLTDIGGDPDDQQSLVRMLVYADEYELEGIIPEHWAGKEHRITPRQQMDLVMSYVDAYDQVLPNLRLHSKEYPSAAKIRNVVKRGAINMPFALDNHGHSSEDMLQLIGTGRDTEGSDWIIQVVDKEDERPVDISVWGGTADLAQALWKVQHTRSQEELERFIRKIRVHAISDQDPTSRWIRINFPGLFYVLNHSRDGDKWKSCYRGMFSHGDESLTSREWVRQYVKEKHGPLGALYPDQTSTGANLNNGLKEGDTPSWFYFLNNGLNVPAHPEYGGWGGRFSRNGSYYQDAEDQLGQAKDGTVTTWRWRPVFQNDFAARMDRCVKPYNEANHNPVAILNGDTTIRMLEIHAAPGGSITLSAKGSRDPDDNRLSYRWWVYHEAGTYGNPIVIHRADAIQTSIAIPQDAQNKTIHVILEVTDDGIPSLTSYRRLVICVN